MISRQKLLRAAARVFGEHGFRGATTRRIAEQAGVNEVTLFRLFGSKSALIAEAVREYGPPSPQDTTLPDVPSRPLRELERYSDALLAHMRLNRGVIRKAMAELNEHPEMAGCMSEGRDCAFHELLRWTRRLERPGPAVSEAEARAAVAMLLAALFADAMWRDVGRETYPQPEARASRLYATLFLRALNCLEPRRATRAAATKNGARRPSTRTRP
ncbi:MAG TPA: helix-turn-helix domain-containing protein [Gemmatimonadaceae bacterium]|nr:helix-turn-helix domain-containing protein [Gemmatimonadaceae bacterium]